MQKKIFFSAVCLLSLLLFIQFSCNDKTAATDKTATTDKPAGTDSGTTKNGIMMEAPYVASAAPFPDFGFMLSPQQADTMGIRVFRLAQDYPVVLPTPALPDFFKTDFKKDWKNYLLQVQKYCFEGNTETDFRVEDNKVRSWYHMPWQHYGPNAREGYHGLTKEAPVKPFQLASGQSYSTGGAWAVGFFNDIAGYTIGQVWKDHNSPDVKAMGSGFKNGTVLFKILFASIPQDIAEKQVPFLQNGQWWDAYATYNFNSTERKSIKVALIQMDVMIRDERAPNGWIFGNFQYNGKMNKPNKWENLVPVGIMWGQDPTNNTNQSNPQPKRTIINTSLTETIINPDSTELPATHLGWNGRLNGPVDNPQSSCYSCHSTAEYPQGSPISPLFDADTLKANPIGSTGWMRWFSNLKCGTPFDGPTYQSTDFCLQMAEAVQNFETWKTTQGGIFYNEYKTQSKKVRSIAKPAAPRKVFALGRRNI
jgi:hypothetical protein